MDLEPTPYDGAVYTRRIVGIENEYGITAVARPGEAADKASAPQDLKPEVIARRLFAPVVDKYSSSNVFTPNASRLYLDVGAHPEIATPECDSVEQLLAYDRAGDHILDGMARALENALAEQATAAKVYLFKNNVDSVGNSYGCHENYLVGRDMQLRALGKQLQPFLITRQLICGAGMIGKNDEDGFLISQRADHVWEGISSATTRSRPMINTRDEPHGDSRRFRRMHVIVGDTNMAEPTTALKVGSMLLVLEMIEAGFSLPDFELARGIEPIKEIARDQTGSTHLELADGRTVTALEIQQQIFAAASTWAQQRPEGGTSPAMINRILDLWGRMLTAIETQNFAEVQTEIDWVIKKTLVDRYRERLGVDYGHAKLRQIDLAYHDIRPGRGLARVLETKGLISRWQADGEVETAVATAPATTRAHLRGRFLAAAEACGAPVAVDWVNLKLSKPEPKVVDLKDPFATVDERVDELIATMESNFPGNQRQ